jgi:hypothetical protein
MVEARFTEAQRLIEAERKGHNGQQLFCDGLDEPII